MEKILELARALGASELETLISELADIRAGKQPEVPLMRPNAFAADVMVSIQSNPSIEARRLKDGRIRLWLRNAGLGWMAFNLGIDQSVTLRDYLIANTDPDARPGLFSDGNGQGSTSH